MNDRTQTTSGDSRSGIMAGLGAYGLWGLMPLYFAALRGIPAGEILAQRIIWCGLLLAGLLAVFGRWPVVIRTWRAPTIRRTLFTTAILLSINWLAYIHGVTSGQAVEASLGYFINPLLNVALGVVFFRERLRPLQFCALGLAVIGVLNLVFAAGQLPWIALTIASSFAVYGLLRKTAPVDAFIGLSIEAFILLPVALAYGAYLGFTRALHLGAIDRTTDGLLLSSGLVTAVPLLLFGVAARNLRLSTLGFLQFLAPTIQFLLAISVLGETMAPEKWASFACIWVALAVYSIDTGRAMQQLRTERAVIRRWQPQPAVSQID